MSKSYFIKHDIEFLIISIVYFLFLFLQCDGKILWFTGIILIFSLYSINNRRKYNRKIKSFQVLYSFRSVQRKQLLKKLISIGFVLLIISGVLYFSTVYKLSINLNGNQKIALSLLFLVVKIIHSYCNSMPDRIYFLAEGILNFEDATVTSYSKVRIEKINETFCKIFLRNIETNELYGFVVGMNSEIGFPAMKDFLQTKTNMSGVTFI